MKSQQVSEIIGKAQDICSVSGTKLTEKRKRILELLLLAQTPLSAYEVADAYNKSSGSSIPPMSVYRILDFLESEHLVHKLSSANKYIACSHINCGHAHEVPQFLICGECQSVKEVSISKATIEDIRRQIVNAGYQLVSSQLELQCVCESCAQSKV